MGYWSTHPMGGDSPQDEVWQLDDIIGMDRYEAEEEGELGKFKKEIIDNLEFIIQEFSSSEFAYALPWTIFDFEIRIKDPKLSQAVKEMIGDGGAADRGYEEDETDSPLTYSKNLEAAWDDLMSGKIHFKSVDLEEPGLFAEFFKSKANNETGLINKK